MADLADGLGLVVGFAAMGASVWLSAQAAKQTQRNSQLAGQLYQASRTKSQEAPASKSAWTNWRATIPV